MDKGCIFMPTVEELVSCYLKNKMLGSGFGSESIVDAEVYGKDKTPWEAFNFPGNTLPWQPVLDIMGVPQNNSRCLYVFTRLQNVGRAGKKQKTRVAGIGSWHNDRSTPVYNVGCQLIGYCKVFTFVPDREIETLGQWTMNEYSIEPAAHPELRGIDCDNVVVCRIKRDDNKCCKAVKRANKRPRAEHLPQPVKKPRLTKPVIPVAAVPEIIDVLDEDGEVLNEAVDMQSSEQQILNEAVDHGNEEIPWDDWILDSMNQSQGCFLEDFSNSELCFSPNDDLNELLTCGVG